MLHFASKEVLYCYGQYVEVCGQYVEVSMWRSVCGVADRPAGAKLN